jgi:Fur family transcriptional regulator, ferric uptake regulator
MRSSGRHDHDHPPGEGDALLRAHGLRRTPQRQATLEAIEALAGHATADDIVARVKERVPAISPSTVYRTLATLEEAGIICHAHLGHTASVYHLGTGGMHQHLVCERCGDLVESDPTLTEPFAAALLKRFGFRANFTHFAILGECRSCAAATPRPRRAGPAGRARR